jgi:hypothetical protein
MSMTLSSGDLATTLTLLALAVSGVDLSEDDSRLSRSPEVRPILGRLLR